MQGEPGMSGLIPIAIYVLVPLGGLRLYQTLDARMGRMNVPDPPRLVMAILLFTYGGWLLVILTDIFWYWSGLASLGVLYLIAVAPIIIAGTAAGLYPRRNLSGFHKLTFAGSITYVMLSLAALAGLMFRALVL
jgi:hypothetical protein